MLSKSKPNLYLVGFMGTGKSTVGRQVAQRMGMKFIDSDHAIEVDQRRSIADIFNSDGEAAFREMERNFLEGGHPNEACVIACGGGMVTQPGMMDLVKDKGLVFALIATPQGIWERTQFSTNRPLLRVKDPLTEIGRLLMAREPIYRQAHVRILTEGRNVSEVVGHVCRSYKQEVDQLQP